MKKFYILLIGLCLILQLKAQVERTLEVTAGNLGNLIDNEPAPITSLTLTGTINAWDIRVIGYIKSLTYLDISHTDITATYMEYADFRDNWWPGMTISRNSINDRGITIPKLKTIKLPNTIQVLGCGAFYGCGLTSITFPASLKTIGFEAFCTCDSLKSLSIPAHVRVSEYAFASCTGLKEVVFEEGFDFLSRGVFAGCTSLTSITFPSTLEIIQYNAFGSCPNIKTIYCKNPVPPAMESASFVMLDKSQCTVYVPAGSASLYKTDEDWKEFTNIVEMTGFTLSDTTLNLEAAASVQAIEIATEGEWSAICEDSWLTVNPSSGQSSQEITLTCQQNNLSIPRTAKVIFSDANGYSQTVEITQLAKANNIPVANAGTDQSVEEGAVVQLDGSASTDADNDALTYQWTAPVGITLSNDKDARPTFTAPNTDKDTIYTFKLVVNDGKEMSVSDRVKITVINKTITLGLSADTAVFESGAGSDTLMIMGNAQWTVSCDQQWLTLTPSSGEGQKEITITAQTNTSTAERTATVIVSAPESEAKALTVIQKRLVTSLDEMTVDGEIKIYPNPFTSYLSIVIANPLLMEVNVEIFTISGQKLKTLLKAQKGQKISLVWDGNDEQGQKVPAGIYLLKVNGEIIKVVRR